MLGRYIQTFNSDPRQHTDAGKHQASWPHPSHFRPTESEHTTGQSTPGNINGRTSKISVRVLAHDPRMPNKFQKRGDPRGRRNWGETWDRKRITALMKCQIIKLNGTSLMRIWELLKGPGHWSLFLCIFRWQKNCKSGPPFSERKQQPKSERETGRERETS